MSLFYHALAYTFQMLTFIFMGMIFIIHPLSWEMVTFYNIVVIMLIVVFARLANVIAITIIYNYEYP
jgi:NhaP-type Na+/H+ or K+/H+ antiporter